MSHLAKYVLEQDPLHAGVAGHAAGSLLLMWLLGMVVVVFIHLILSVMAVLPLTMSE